jgi:hypothetical protein
MPYFCPVKPKITLKTQKIGLKDRVKKTLPAVHNYGEYFSKGKQEKLILHDFQYI